MKHGSQVASRKSQGSPSTVDRQPSTPFLFTAGKPNNRFACTRCGAHIEWLYRDPDRGWEAVENFKKAHSHQPSAVSEGPKTGNRKRETSSEAAA